MEKQADEIKQRAAMGERERGYMASKAVLQNIDKTLAPDKSTAAQVAPPGEIITPSQLGQQASEFKLKRDASDVATKAP
jgi:hypothetical protein